MSEHSHKCMYCGWDGNAVEQWTFSGLHVCPICKYPVITMAKYEMWKRTAGKDFLAIKDLRAKLEEAEIEITKGIEARAYLESVIADREKERDNLQVKLEEAEFKAKTYEKENKRVCDAWNKDAIEYARTQTERDQLQATNGELRGALEQAVNIMSFHAARCLMNIPNNFSGSEEHLAEYRNVYQKVIPEVLHTTPPSAYNRLKELE